MSVNDRVSTWINAVLRQLSSLEHKTGAGVLHNCGAECLKSSVLLEGAATIRDELAPDRDPDRLFHAFKLRYYNSPDLLMQGDIITLVFNECTCPLVREAGVDNPYLCNCTVGYTTGIFETLFGRKVEVELERSILRGDSMCRQRIKTSV